MYVYAGCVHQPYVRWKQTQTYTYSRTLRALSRMKTQLRRIRSPGLGVGGVVGGGGPYERLRTLGRPSRLSAKEPSSRERAGTTRMCLSTIHTPLRVQGIDFPSFSRDFLSLARTRTLSLALSIYSSLASSSHSATFSSIPLFPTLEQQTVRVGIIVLVPDGSRLLTLLMMKPWACSEANRGRQRGCLLTEQRLR